jgi:aconitate hydratase
VRVEGRLPAGSTATDLVLTLTEMLRKHGVVGKFVEFCGDGLSSLTVADRATLSNMCPEYGATSALFPVDSQTLRYLKTTGRPDELLQLVETYCRAQGLFREDGMPIPAFSELLELDLSNVEPSIAGPRRPQDRVALANSWQSFHDAFPMANADDTQVGRFEDEGGGGTAVAAHTLTGIRNGAVVIAAITSCTNTSNPSVMVAAGLLAKKANERGLEVPAYVKTSLAPGSRVVTDYLNQAGLMAELEKLGFFLVGYGCTTCIGNSGPLASPPLVVAFALAGTIHRDLTTEPVGYDREGRPVMLSELWPAAEEVERVITESVRQEFFTREYDKIYDGDEYWQRMQAPTGAAYAWDADSAYVQNPPYFEGMEPQPAPLRDLEAARVLVMLGDSVTTDHISPAGSIAVGSPAGQYLQEHGVAREDFNSYGARRGNHEVMVRGTFANIRLRNELAQGKEGWWTRHQPSGEEMTIFEASRRYAEEGVPLVVVAGKEYGSGSSRDWAAKGPNLQGVKAVIAESFERIHRSNLVGMGILPLVFTDGATRQSLGLTGAEEFTIRGVDKLKPAQELEVEAKGAEGEPKRFRCLARIDNPTELEYLQHGGVLPYVLRQLMTSP